MTRRKPRHSCADCEERTDKLFDDQRDPPLDDGPCLCARCASYHIDDRISDLESEIKDLEAIKRKIRS